MIEFNERYEVQATLGIISNTGIYEVVKLLNSQDLRSDAWKALNPDMNRSFLPPLSGDWDWVWMLPKGVYRGTLPKRIGAFYAKMYNIKCPQTLLTQVGNIARAHTDSGEIYRFEFVNQIDWYAGEFGEDDDSCYWNQYAGARQMITNNGGFAVRFYDERDNGLARAWLAPIGDEMHILWNGYGFRGNATLTIAHIVALHLNVSYKKIGLTNRGTAYSVLYINGGIGYAIGETAKIQKIEAHDLRWYEIDIRVCHECGDEIDEGDSYAGADDHSYCERCYERLFDTCYECEETYWVDDLHYADESMICDDCLRQYYVLCFECGEYTHHQRTREREGKHYCENCFEE